MKTLLITIFLLSMLLLVGCEKQEELSAAVMIPSPVNVGGVYFPVNTSLLNYSFFNSSFANFSRQNIRQENLSAYGQSNSSACYVLIANSTRNVSVSARVINYNSSYPIFLTLGFNNRNSTKYFLNTTFVNISIIRVFTSRVVNESFTWEYNTTVRLNKSFIANLSVTNSSGGFINSSFYNSNLTMATITPTSTSNFTNIKTRNSDIIRLRVGRTIPLIKDNIKNGTFLLFNTTQVLNNQSVFNYTLNLMNGSIRANSVNLNNSVVYANYSYYEAQTFKASYEYSESALLNISCFGSYINVPLNATYNSSIEFNFTEI